MSIKLNKKSIESNEKLTGIPYHDIILMDVDQIDGLIEKKIRKKLKFNFAKNPFDPRGSVYLTLCRFFDFNTKNLDKKIDSLRV